VLNETYDRIDSRSRITGTTGVPSGLTDLDSLTSGFQNGEMVIIAARPSVGKTAFALNMARYMSIEAKHAVLFVSLEMGRIELAERMLAAQANVDQNYLRKGSLSIENTTKIEAAGNKMRQAPLFVDDSPDTTMLKIAAKARALKQTKGLRAVFIDYLQLIQPEDRRAPRQEQVAQISRRIKLLARELSIPVIALAQINRNSEGREGGVPRISDLRESGSLEQDADTVMLLHRPERLNPAERPGEIDVMVEKQRSGPTGIVALQFIKSTSKFDNLDVHSPFNRN
jgi:replicative DNA helicase